MKKQAPILVFLLLGLLLGAWLGGRGHGRARTPAAAVSHAEHTGGGGEGEAAAEGEMYMCPMMCVDPRPEPGRCPVCGMDLVPVPAGMADGGGDGSRLAMSESAMRLARVRTAPVERRFVDVELRLAGRVGYDETRSKSITAWAPGRVERLFVDQTGVKVRRGDDLFEIYSRELTRLASSLVVASRGTGADSGDLLDGSRRSLRLYGLMDDQIRRIEQLGAAEPTAVIRAPINGTVIEKHAEQGVYVNEGQLLFRIADLDRVWVNLDAYESDLSFLRYGQVALIRVEAYGDEIFHGWISFISPMVDRVTRATRVRVVVDNPEGRLKPNMFARATVLSRVGEGGLVVPSAEYAGKWISPRHPEIVSDSPGDCPVCGIELVAAEELGYGGGAEIAPALVVPASAVLHTGTRGLVYALVPDAEQPTFEGITVELGPRAGDWQVIRSGIEAGVEVAVEGAFQIDSQLQLTRQPSMTRPAAAGGSPAAAQHHHAPGDAETAPAPHDSAAAGEAEAPAEEFLAGLAEVLKAYYRAVERFTNDDNDGALLAGREMRESIAAASGLSSAPPSWGGLGASIKEALAVMDTHADDIEAARAAFEAVSSTLETAARRYGPFPGVAVRRVFCPMAFGDTGAYWLQEDTTVSNPYEGSRMPRCGVVRETIFEGK